MTTVVVLARLLLAATFLVSGVAKLIDLEGTRRAVREFGFPAWLAPATAVTLPATELAAVALLAGGPGLARAGAALILTMLVVFTALIVRTLIAGREVECRCFGGLSDQPLGVSSVARNVSLAALAALVLLAPERFRGSAVWTWFSTTPAPDVATALAILVLSALCAALVRFSLIMVKKYGGLLLRLEALESGAPVAWRSDSPLPAPPVELPTLDGPTSSIADLVRASPTQRTLVIFMSEDCRPCGLLAPQLPALHQKYAATLPAAVIATGTVDNVTAKFGGTPDLPVLITAGLQEQYAYGIAATPSAVIVEGDLIVAGPVGGADDIERLWAAAASSPTAGAGAAVRPTVLHQLQPRPRSVGDSVEDLEVSRDGIAQLPLADVLGREARVLLYWDSACGFCEQLAPDLAGRLEGRSDVMVISRDAPGTEPGFRADTVFVGDELASALDLPGTPSAVTVDARGQISSPVAAGGPAVLLLLEQARLEQAR